jgi:hypothetical protein
VRAARDEHHREALLRAEVGEPELQLGAGQVVERPEGLIQQEERTILHDGAQQRDPLAHPARELERVGLLAPLEPERGQQLRDALTSLATGHAAQHESERGVVLDRQPRHQQVLLRHVRREGSPGVAIAVEAHLTGCRSQLLGEDAEQRRFSGSARSDDRDELALVHVQGDVLKHGGLAELGTVRLGDRVDLQQGTRHRCAAFLRRSHGSSSHSSR